MRARVVYLVLHSRKAAVTAYEEGTGAVPMQKRPTYSCVRSLALSRAGVVMPRTPHIMKRMHLVRSVILLPAESP